MAAASERCVPVARWAMPTEHGVRLTSARAVLDAMAQRPVVLLGELHDRAEHHRWQLQTLAALHAQGDGIVLGFEMFPRRVQGVLERWIAGELSEREFLERVEWSKVWGFDAGLYLPLFEFARMNRIPIIALNVERGLVRQVGREGYDAVPQAKREGVGRPAAPTPRYLQELHAVYRQHGDTEDKALDDPAFLRFVAAQQTWDRAMAEAIRDARLRYAGKQVVAVMGRGHTGPDGVPYQLRDLGIAQAGVLLPWEPDDDCARLLLGYADAVFGVEAPRASAAGAARPLLGVTLAPVEGGGVRIDQVSPGSIAQATDLRAGDVVLAMAGRAIKAAADVQRTVSRLAPGTWLPIRVRREDAELELVAKFPAEPEPVSK